MRYLTLKELVELHRRVIEQSGGGTGIRDLGLLEAARAQPHRRREGFGGRLLTHQQPPLRRRQLARRPRGDGSLLALNGYEIEAGVGEQEGLILAIASGTTGREGLTEWLRGHVVERE